MGRELKRVALDFEWPLNKVWSGFLNPHYINRIKCVACGESGNSPEYQQLSDRWYGRIPFRPEDRGSTPYQADHPVIQALTESNYKRVRDRCVTEIERLTKMGAADDLLFEAQYRRLMADKLLTSESQRLADLFNSRWMCHLNADDVAALIEAGRLLDFTHTWSRENGWVPIGAPNPSPNEVNDRYIGGMGHDSINQYCVCVAEAKRLGYDINCSECAGHGYWFADDAEREAYEAWTESQPPAGDGFQMWENTSEGSPISPVFKTAEELARWLADTNASAFGGGSASYESWMKMIDAGWAPSGLIIDGQMINGVEAVGAISA